MNTLSDFFDRLYCYLRYVGVSQSAGSYHIDPCICTAVKECMGNNYPKDHTMDNQERIMLNYLKIECPEALKQNDWETCFNILTFGKGDWIMFNIMGDNYDIGWKKT